MTGDEPQKPFRALLDIHDVDFIHNDLSNAAFYFKEEVASRIERDDREALFLHMMAALTMTAFALEAYLNFVGSQKTAKWDFQTSVANKLKALCDTFGIAQESAARPFSTIAELVKLRNTLAHGKPKITEIREEAIGTHDELTARVRSFQADWEKQITPQFVSEAYEDVEAIWKALLQSAGIEVIETLSHGSRGVEFRGFVEEGS